MRKEIKSRRTELAMIGSTINGGGDGFYFYHCVCGTGSGVALMERE